ncbi:hypothetical protein SAMN04489761_0849 [Tenacibaculum sp. MAR_2009_124]|uniref:hypothetical protein n=1 Tax=Tenacibaculum sp. MAR_2009_124 TaxID=1250059 RepID=UPI000896D628|nr:hypothetical protein [Tenacibaculum sp. MAR_2009_124]SEB46031.1 hypothetical protein SAMN04489761_0849 [Tenacibaculum sp. MAR_2009_124]
MKTTIKIAVIAMIGMNLGVKAQDLISGGNNSWIFHTPDNGSTNLHVTSRKTDNTGWDWSKQTIFSSNGKVSFGGDLENTKTFAKILLGSQNGDGLSVFGSMGAGQPVDGTQDYGAYIGFNAYRDSNGNWKHLRTSTVGASRYTVGGDIATGLRGFNWEHTNNSGTGNIIWNNLMSLDTSGNLKVNGSIKANTHLYVNGIDNSNTIASVNQLKISGYGIMGNRGNLYFTNGSSDGFIKFGIGGVHNTSDVLILKGSDKSANFKGVIEADTHLYINGIDNSNTIASINQLKISGYGIMGNRGSLYFTNGNSNGVIKFGIGGVHNTGDVLILKGSDKSANFKGNVSIFGKLESKEIKVTNTPTADFVFEEDYNLPTLKSIENHIKEKKHLPEIASAKEMQKNGVNIGDFQIQLLQKIEELTLYTIEQEKKLKTQRDSFDQQQEEINTQKKEIEELKKQNFEIRNLVQKLLKDKK